MEKNIMWTPEKLKTAGHDGLYSDRCFCGLGNLYSFCEPDCITNCKPGINRECADNCKDRDPSCQLRYEAGGLCIGPKEDV